MGKKQRGITFLLTYLWDRIFIFLFVALCLLASLTDLFVHLNHYGLAILVISLTIPSTIFWLCGMQPEDPTHPKSTVSLMATVFFSSTDPTWATFAILDTSRDIEAITVSTSFLEGKVRNCLSSSYSLNIWKHWLPTTLGMWDMSYRHHSWCHVTCLAMKPPTYATDKSFMSQLSTSSCCTCSETWIGAASSVPVPWFVDGSGREAWHSSTYKCRLSQSSVLSSSQLVLEL